MFQKKFDINKQIKKYAKQKCAKRGLAQQNEILIEMENYAGPMTLIKFYNSVPSKTRRKLIEEAKRLTQYYSLKSRDKKDVKWKLR